MYLKKDLGKLIDKLISIEPALEGVLDPIKKRYIKQTKIVQDCWNKLIFALNNYSFNEETKNKVIKSIIPPRPVRRKGSFEPPHPNEKIIGTIPENMADTIRRQDKALLQMQKLQLEAQITNNRPLFVDLSKKHARIDIQQKKMWLDLRNHFNLWNKEGKYFSIREKGPVLVLTEPKTSSGPPELHSPDSPPPMGIIQINPEILRQFFRMMNIQPPPGMFPDEGDE